MNLKFRSLFQKDIDQVFSYRTNVEVVILDRYVGIIYRILQLLIIAFFFYINITGKSQAFNQEYSRGISLVEITGSGLSADSSAEFYDEMDIIHPEIFSDSLFLATNIRFWTQIKGNCVDTSYSCTKDADCKSLFKDKCLNGSCSSYGWCGQTNDYTIKYDISDNMLIWVRSFIQFAEFESSPSIYSSFYSNDPNYNAEKINVFSLNQLLEYSPEIVTFSSLKDSGGILKVNLLWKCQIFQYCEPEIKVRRLDMQGSDSLFGYSSVKYTYHKAANGDLERTTHNMTGVRVIFNTEGIGFRLSVENIIFQIANLVALLFLPKILADFILIYVLRYEDYASYKYENTLNLAKNQDDSEIGNEEIPSVIEKQEEEKKEEEEDDVSLLKDIDSD